MTKTILYAKNTFELIKTLNNNPGIQIVGGCTNLEDIPEKFVSTHGIKELSQIIRHERFIEVGPGATLAELQHVGQNHLPQILTEALNSIATPYIRNMATVGGNICSSGFKHTLYAPLLALDAKLEFKNQTETKMENIRNFKSIPEGFILSNIRIPLVNAELSIFRKIGHEQKIGHNSASFAFIADTEKNTLLNVHLAFAGPFTFCSKDFENAMIGTRLPLTQKDITRIEELVAEEFQKASIDQMISDVMKQQFFNLVRYSFEQLT